MPKTPMSGARHRTNAAGARRAVRSNVRPHRAGVRRDEPAMTAGLDQRWRRATAAAVVNTGDRVLDACCGTGTLRSPTPKREAA